MCFKHLNGTQPVTTEVFHLPFMAVVINKKYFILLNIFFQFLVDTKKHTIL